tara:strand:- start:182 stop:1678 length:1497 start_codon:yes stop_codon:yes gene_type:complete
MERIIITDKNVCSFYKEHPYIDVNSINRLCVELLNSAINNSDVSTTNTFHQKILSEISENNRTVSLLHDTLTSIKSDNLHSFITEMTDIKDDYLDELKTMVITETTDKITTIMEANNSNLLNKTVDVIRTIIPNINAKQFEEINRSLYSFQKAIAGDTQTLLKSVDTHSLKDYMNNFEIKSSLMLQNIQQPILSSITASEERITNNVNSVKDNIATTEETHKTMFHNMSSALNNEKSKSNIENITNNHFVSFLTKSFASADISSKLFGMNTPTTVMKRIRKPDVLIHNYELDTNVSSDEMASFMNVLSDENKCGILISQHSGISNKNDFQIEFHNNNVIIFVHNSEYSNHKIEAAVNIIDHLYFKLQQFNKTGINDDFTIPKDVLEIINNEYQMFMTQKLAVIDVLKESQKKVIAQIDEIKFPSLDKYLSGKYSAPIIKTGLKCDICKCYSANNLKALAAHKRGCMRKHGLSVKTNEKSRELSNRNEICITPISMKEN